jgi:hypothetical protein
MDRDIKHLLLLLQTPLLVRCKALVQQIVPQISCTPNQHSVEAKLLAIRSFSNF